MVQVLLRSILFINSFAVHRLVRPQLREFNHTSAIVLHSSLFLLVFLIRRQGLAFSARSIVFWTVDNQRRRRAAIAGFRTCCSEAGSICVSPPTKSTYQEPFGRSGTLVHITCCHIALRHASASFMSAVWGGIPKFMGTSSGVGVVQLPTSENIGSGLGSRVGRCS